MVTAKTPLMEFNKKGIHHIPRKTFRVNDSIVLAVYKGSISPLDILIRYRQKLRDGRWSNIRTPKHIHWVVDILMKMQSYKELTEEFIDFFITVWHETTPLSSDRERSSLDLGAILNLSEKEITKFSKLSHKGEYSVKFLILLAKLLMIQEKTNRADAYMFKKALDSLKEGKDLFRILATASFSGRI